MSCTATIVKDIKALFSHNPMDGQTLCNGIEHLELVEGEVLIQEGDLGDTAYCIISGEVLVSKAAEHGQIELARLGPGSIIGEMSIVDERPRSASVHALCPTSVKCIRRSDFLNSFRDDPEFAASLLKVLLERLRETGSRLAELQQARPLPFEPCQSAPDSQPSSASADLLPAQSLDCSIVLEGLTNPARESLPSNPLMIDRLPFRIGRETNDPLANNDLSLIDFEPYQVSIHHLLIFQEQSPGGGGGRIGVFDRGSAQGTWINGSPLGGLMADENATYLDPGEVELVIGSQDSLFRYRLSISPRSRP